MSNVYYYDNGFILPFKTSESPGLGLGGVLDGEGNFVPHSAHGDTPVLFGGKYEFDINAARHVNCDVVYLGVIPDHWGSFLYDFLARIWYVLEEPGKYKLAYCGRYYPPDTFGVISAQAYEFLSLLGISRDQMLDIRLSTRFGKVIVPELSFLPGSYIRPEYGDMFRIAAANTRLPDARVYEKIYFTRTAMKNRKEVGEGRIERFFAANGFHVVSPERLSVAMQIHLFSTCRVMASIEGTIAHGIMFASPGARQIILRKQSWENPRQHFFNELKRVPADYIDVYIEPFKRYPVSHDDGPFLLLRDDDLSRYAESNGMLHYRALSKSGAAWLFAAYLFKCVRVELRRFLMPARNILSKNKHLKRIYRKIFR